MNESGWVLVPTWVEPREDATVKLPATPPDARGHRHYHVIEKADGTVAVEPLRRAFTGPTRTEPWDAPLWVCNDWTPR